MREGVVALVGAGPGDPGLLTIRGRRWLRRADVVVYDRLVDPRLLDQVPRRALRIFAGKGRGYHSLPQDEINTILIAQAKRGRRVVRLKGGDPFVFGRGGEEAEALAAAGIPFEVVPGVSAAVAVPAAAGIPVTDRRLASSVAVVTGHQHAGPAAPRVDWPRLATAVDTLVIVMGLASLRRIAAELTAHGRRPDTPVALIEHGTTATERVVVGTLADIADRADALALTPPVLAVIGEVVRLRDRLSRPDLLPTARRAGRRASSRTPR
jgi:uroporphyrinogen III methyltransferase / synthase